jgi:hypothetical protein
LQITRQKKYFNKGSFLFVRRYPQNKDIIRWLKIIPNSYLHFGDFDFAGINIYYNEFKKHLGDRANFFIPNDIENLLKQFGNRKLFTNQTLQHSIQDINEPNLFHLIHIINQYGKGLEQECMIEL